MFVPRTPDLLAWDLPLPIIHPTQILGLELGADVPRFADTRTHICGFATGVVSA